MKRLTKRQRKAVREPNHATRKSLEQGELQTVAGVDYAGYASFYGVGNIPFVRATQKERFVWHD